MNRRLFFAGLPAYLCAPFVKAKPVHDAFSEEARLGYRVAARHEEVRRIAAAAMRRSNAQFMESHGYVLGRWADTQ